MDDFTAASTNALQFLSKTFDLALWMVTRLENDDWIVLSAEDRYYGLAVGDVFRGADSICSRMLAGLGPHLAPDLAAVPAYAETPIAKRLKIGAYFSLPIHHADGRVFGMLCGADPVKQPEDIILRLAPVRLVADMLSHVLAIEMRCVASERECERIASEATRDALTGLYNRRGWMQFIDKEEWRCRRYGHSACILSIDLDGLKRANDSQGHAHGDDLLRRAGDVISETLRKSDIVARVGGDEFCILCIECEIDQIDGLVVRLREKLAEAGVSASIGRAMRIPGEGLEAACTKADHDMYLDKAQRRELAGHEFG